MYTNYAGGMPFSERLGRIDVIVHSDPAQWWQIAAALAPLVLALALAAFAAWYAVAQRRRRLPWSRIRQALDMALDEGPEQRAAGLAMLDQLSTSRGLREVDAEIVGVANATLKKPQL